MVDLQKFGLQDHADVSQLCIRSCKPADSLSSKGNIEVTLDGRSTQKHGAFQGSSGAISSFLVHGGRESSDVREAERDKGMYVPTVQHEDLLARMLLSHMNRDICLVGGKVKSTVHAHVFILSWS